MTLRVSEILRAPLAVSMDYVLCMKLKKKMQKKFNSSHERGMNSAFAKTNW